MNFILSYGVSLAIDPKNRVLNEELKDDAILLVFRDLSYHSITKIREMGKKIGL